MSKFTHGAQVDVGFAPGFHGEPGRYLIAGAEFGVPRLSAHCARPSCLEWPCLELLDALGRPARSWVFHVCECVMRPLARAHSSLDERPKSSLFGALVPRARDFDAIHALRVGA